MIIYINCDRMGSQPMDLNDNNNNYIKYGNNNNNKHHAVSQATDK
jgi:hypothetical protein